MRPVIPILPLPVVAVAACRTEDPALFYPPGNGRFLTSNDPGDYAAGRAICKGCPVRPECLEHALRVPETEGLWGGLTPPERKRLRSARRAATAPDREAARAL